MTDRKPLTEQQLTDIETRAAAAPEAPWALSDDLEGDGYPGHLWVVRTPASGPDEPDDHSAVVSIGDRALGEFIAHAPEDVNTLLAEVRHLRAVLEQIRHLHKDSPMGPCPVCIDADAAAAGGDGLVPYPCPTGRLAGAQDCDPPHMRAAAAGERTAAETADPYAESPDAGDDSACNCGGAWHARRQHCVDWPCPGCTRICPPEPGVPSP
jgi:hypothetical protein